MKKRNPNVFDIKGFHLWQHRPAWSMWWTVVSFSTCAETLHTSALLLCFSSSSFPPFVSFVASTLQQVQWHAVKIMALTLSNENAKLFSEFRESIRLYKVGCIFFFSCLFSDEETCELSHCCCHLLSPWCDMIITSGFFVVYLLFFIFSPSSWWRHTSWSFHTKNLSFCFIWPNDLHVRYYCCIAVLLISRRGLY